ncbi:hypothetical protein CW706_02970 [Candidatus Bathyarchaeota archaeon]|nr:MAG: hypothetical protein CW706_02970 [Candidatus Bathyarchaeota archaeon]
MLLFFSVMMIFFVWRYYAHARALRGTAPKVGLESIIFAFEAWGVIVSSAGTLGLLARIARLLKSIRSRSGS